MPTRLIYYALWAVGLTLAGNPLLRSIPGRLGQDWAVHSLMGIQPHLLGFAEPRTSKIYSTIWEFGVPLAAAMMLLVVFHMVRPRLRPAS